MKRQWEARNGMGNGGLLPMLMPGDDLPDGNLLVNSRSNFFKETINRRQKLTRWEKNRDYFVTSRCPAFICRLPRGPSA